MSLRRFLGYGLAGWGLEMFFTSVTDSLSTRDRRLKGHSYLWMLPIYGAGGMVLERLRDRLQDRGVPRWGRSFAYMAGIYGVEYGSGAFLNRLLGDVPWRYQRGLNLSGYVRLDYAPFWYACGWLFESLEDELRKLDRPSRKAFRRLSERGEGEGASLRRPGPRASAAPAPAGTPPRRP